MGINLLVNVNGSGYNALESSGRYLYFDKEGDVVFGDFVGDIKTFRNKTGVTVVSVLSDVGKIFGEVSVMSLDGVLKIFDVESVGRVKRFLYGNEFLLRVVREEVYGGYLRVMYVFPLGFDVLAEMRRGGVLVV